MELYGETLVVSSKASSESDEAFAPAELVEVARGLFPNLEAVLWKFRSSLDPELAHGRLYLPTFTATVLCLSAGPENSIMG